MPIIALLTALSPLILKGGLWVIDKFIANEADKQAASLAFVKAIQQHASDALQTVADRKSLQNQIDDLNKA